MASLEGASPFVGWRFVRNVILKAGALSLFLNLAFAALDPMPALARLSLYNTLFPGRQRLPYGDDPKLWYNVSVLQIDALLSSHELVGEPKRENEVRLLLLGDSSIWGFLLPANQTLSAYLNLDDYHTRSGRRIRAFNLGYPTLSLTKDLLILSRGLDYNPDLIVWFVTLESFPYEKQLDPPLLRHNPKEVRALIDRFNLQLDPYDDRFVEPTFLDRTIVGRRKPLADLIRLQLYGALWAATSIDQYIPESFTPRMDDLPADENFQGFDPQTLTEEDLAFEVLAAGVQAAGDVPVVIINEPIFISRGANSDVRYNYYYPRWAYDRYRRWLQERGTSEGWTYVDLWDALPAAAFTNTAIHYTPQSAKLLAERVARIALEVIDP